MNFFKAILSILLVSVCFNFYGQVIQYNLVNCTITGEEKKAINEMFRFELDYFEQVFDYSDSIARVKIFGDFDEYKSYQKTVSQTARSNTGFYSGSLKTVIVYKGKKFVETIKHEMVHLILRNGINKIPKWINEGLAEFFENFYFEDGEVIEELDHLRIKKLQMHIENNEVDLKDFLSLTNDEWRAKNKRIKSYSYRISYGIIYYLYEKEPTSVVDILKEFKTGDKNSVAIIEQTYPGGFKSFNEGFFSFFASLRDD